MPASQNIVSGLAPIHLRLSRHRWSHLSPFRTQQLAVVLVSPDAQVVDMRASLTKQHRNTCVHTSLVYILLDDDELLRET